MFTKHWRQRLSVCVHVGKLTALKILRHFTKNRASSPSNLGFGLQNPIKMHYFSPSIKHLLNIQPKSTAQGLRGGFGGKRIGQRSLNTADFSSKRGNHSRFYTSSSLFLITEISEPTPHFRIFHIGRNVTLGKWVEGQKMRIATSNSYRRF